MIRTLVAVAALLAQAPGAARFEVASIKRNHSGENGIGGGRPGDTYRRTNATLVTVLNEAYKGRFLRWEIVGGPDWLERDKHPRSAVSVPANI